MAANAGRAGSAVCAASTQGRARRLLRAAQRGDRGARDKLVTSHLGLVRAVAARYRDLGLPFDDLVQEGSLGLLEAIDRYDPGRHVEFEAFARFRVRRAIRNALTERARIVRQPKQMVERRRLLARAEATLIAATGRQPTPDELAVATNLSVDAVLESQTAGINPISLDEPAAPGGSPLRSLVADTAAPDPERETLLADRVSLLRGAVDRLTPRQREIVRLHFGLDGCEVELAAIAVDLNISERRTRTLESDALHELAEALAPSL